MIPPLSTDATRRHTQGELAIATFPPGEVFIQGIFKFNIAARYPDEQQQFAKRYDNKKTAKAYLDNTNSILLWLQKKFRNR